MKNAILFLMLSFPLCIFSQARNGNPPGRVSLGVSYSPDFCYRQLAYSQQNDWVSDYRAAEEIPKYGFTTGLNFRYRLNRKFFETGLLYSTKGFKTKEKALDWGGWNSRFPTKSKTEFQFQYIEIPLGLNYIINSGRISYYVSTGFIASRLLGKRSVLKLEYADVNSATIGSTQEHGYKKFSLSVTVGIGLMYSLSDRFLFDIEPVYKQGITSITGNKNASEYLYSLGLSTSIFYTLKK